MASRVARAMVVTTASAGLLAAPALSALAISPAVAAATSATGAGAAKTIHPGGEVNFGDISCEIGAVMRQGATVYLAVPASCGGIDLGKVQDGCVEPVSPGGVPASIGGAIYRGTLVYNSFTEMQKTGVRSPDRCYFNDLALIRVDRRDRTRVTATIPDTSGPRMVSTSMPASGTALRFGSASGSAGGTHNAGWATDVTSTAMLKTADAGAPVTVADKLVGMLTVLPAGPIPDVPLFQTPGQVYSLAKAIKLLREVPRFRHIRLVRAGQRV
ncbi:MAG TPA: hypothetical protein VG899_05950 [Mycobacteriales bacterium]|nr:hypothetical protein [Mycobacteriales bacterium]